MITKTIYSNGHDDFDIYFSSKEWSAPTMVSTKEIRERLDSFNLCGRKIKNLKIVGHCYNYTRDWVENSAYNNLSDLPEDERQAKSNYSAIDDNMLFIRSAEIDEPFLIQFDDGDVFEIDTPQEPEFCFSMNCIPWHIEAGVNKRNADANILFSNCIGAMITEAVVNTYISDRDPLFLIDDFKLPQKIEMVSDITLCLNNGHRLVIHPVFDYCHVDCISNENKYAEMSFSDLKEALYNWEDLHEDETTGIISESGMIYFGMKGSDHCDNPYMKLFSSGYKNSVVHIAVETFDFVLLGWAIAFLTNCEFDEYEDYKFNYTEWISILNIAYSLISSKSFDDLFDVLLNNQEKDCNMLYILNRYGAKIWKNKDRYLQMISELNEWTEIVMKENDSMYIVGY